MTTSYLKTISIMGSYGEGNIGDEAILAGLLHDLRTLNPHTRFVVFSHNPTETEQLHPDVIAQPVLPAGFRSYMSQLMSGSLNRSLKYLKESSEIIIGGGGIFYDHGFSIGKNPIQVWHTRCKTIERLGKRYRLYAVGVSAFEKDSSKKWMHDIAMRAAKVEVRDESSRHNLKKIGVVRPVDIVDDPALHLSAPLHRSTGVLHHGMRIGLCIRDWFLDDPEKQRILHDNLLKLIELLVVSLRTEVIMIPFSIGADDDRVLAQTLIGRSSLPGFARHVRMSNEPHTVDSRLGEVARMDVIISMRLHGVIFAHITDTPWIALGYAEKVKEITRKFGHDDRYIDIESWTPDDIVRMVRTLST